MVIFDIVTDNQSTGVEILVKVDRVSLVQGNLQSVIKLQVEKVLFK